MFEVIYISQSCKQAVNFINDLAIKLKQHEINSFDIDHKNIQLKSDKFIVSAVSINSSNLWRSYGMTKYYIDTVSIAQYETFAQWAFAHDTLRELERSFYIDTKQISEEELIEILKEVSE